jgi:hypothetical protein
VCGPYEPDYGPTYAGEKAWATAAGVFELIFVALLLKQFVDISTELGGLLLSGRQLCLFLPDCPQRSHPFDFTTIDATFYYSF